MKIPHLEEWISSLPRRLFGSPESRPVRILHWLWAAIVLGVAVVVAYFQIAALV
ncbi:hypothetical protein [Roseobacter sp. HKCCA0434]|uniref:hypothetical protein n=1 Tax=Roseobacter sp. HKCCA0434 TaxID=3079297 RepID=UPI002905BC1C|nr:hypothetical protein [Roseobacter sp. HKCCA0434]